MLPWIVTWSSDYIIHSIKFWEWTQVERGKVRSGCEFSFQLFELKVWRKPYSSIDYLIFTFSFSCRDRNKWYIISNNLGARCRSSFDHPPIRAIDISGDNRARKGGWRRLWSVSRHSWRWRGTKRPAYEGYQILKVEYLVRH